VQFADEARLSQRRVFLRGDSQEVQANAGNPTEYHD